MWYTQVLDKQIQSEYRIQQTNNDNLFSSQFTANLYSTHLLSMDYKKNRQKIKLFSQYSMKYKKNRMEKIKTSETKNATVSKNWKGSPLIWKNI